MKQPIKRKKITRLFSARFWLAGPLALVVAISMLAAASIWLPHTDEHLYHLIFPTIMFPLLWVAWFFYPLLDKSVKRSSVVMFLVLFTNLAIVLSKFL